MRNAETVLSIIQERGKRGLLIEDVYRQLFNPDLYLRAYGRIYTNAGSMTRSTTNETVDGMSLKKIENLIQAIRYERYRWSPVKRTYIPKKNGKQRPLGIPTWSDKLLQEVMRSILDAYFDAQFSDHSHGFRPNHGCHTALDKIQTWKGVNWFIEGDIKGCFDNIDHELLLSMLREKIRDNRFIRLVENLLKAGYLEDWKYVPTLSGTPQGGIISPILSNIFLDRLDKFVEHELIPRFTRGEVRKRSREYLSLQMKMRNRKKRGKTEEAKELRKVMQSIPSFDSKDPNFRRLHYVRYADDFLLGFTGSKEEAEEIKVKLREFLKQELKLELSEEKTLITHACTEAARFLGYEISRCTNNSKHDQYGRRSINGSIILRVPEDVVRKRCDLYLENGKPVHRNELIDDHDFSIVNIYQAEYRGYVQYYALALNIHFLNHLRWIMQTSLFRTLAAKYKTSVSEIAGRYKSTVQTSDGQRRCFEVRVEREGKSPLIARFGGIPLKQQQRATIKDQLNTLNSRAGRTELVKRLLADQCEICGSAQNCEVHHLRKLSDLKIEGQKAKPSWMQIMSARQRKTLVVCHDCHVSIHAGKLQKASIGERLPESRMT